MNAQELLASSLITASRNPILDALVVKYAGEHRGNGVELYCTGDQHVFPVLGPTDAKLLGWIFYWFKHTGRELFCYGSQLLQSDATDSQVKMEIAKSFADFVAYLPKENHDSLDS